MKTNIKELPEDAIIAGSESKLLARFSSGKKSKKKLKNLRGILKKHKDAYSSLKLEEKAAEWRADVSD